MFKLLGATTSVVVKQQSKRPLIISGGRALSVSLSNHFAQRKGDNSNSRSTGNNEGSRGSSGNSNNNSNNNLSGAQNKKSSAAKQPGKNFVNNSNKQPQQTLAETIKSKLGLNQLAEGENCDISSSKSDSGRAPGYFGKSKSRGKRSQSSSGIMSSVDQCSIKHDKANQRFIMDLGNGMTARIDYKSIGQNRIDMYHTEVPNELRGKGIGKALAKAAIEHANEDKMKVRLSCTYLVNYLEKYADSKLKKMVDSS